ncbi:methyltransferase domain-containing protein [Nocardiopsis dassonvillei]|uniref:methyltransferase domain-containing protein n=1 Tax=Nocardiopsis dassonvillei TaxID=2014 RepID=UPI00200EFF1B|nr:methyltransferase domain-containing protein [Nocardiopsis dassonvillei]MCK9869046.1 class I SAM-dependent methyltransferase [Nocardiopsis dassonvillei]
MFVSSRSFEEYRAMFALSDRDLSLRVLDCPGGAAGFVAGARGADAVAVDPEYAGGREALGSLALREAEHRHSLVARGAADFVWTWFGSPERYTRMRTRAARAFAADLAARPERYVAGALPDLPFADRSFDLVLSSHLLFSYGARLDEDFHRCALLELVRVARWQVRLFPVVLHTSGERYGALDRLREWLEGRGVRTRLERVGYEFQPGGNEMLLLDGLSGAAGPETDRDGRGRAFGLDPVRWRHLEAGT